MRKTCLKRKGYISAYLLVVGIILWILGAGIMSFGYHANARAARTAHDKFAKAMADTAIDMALSQLDTKFNDGSLDDNALPYATGIKMPNCNGTYSYTITGDKTNGYTITATGDYNGTQRIAELLVQAQRGYHYAAFAKNSISLTNISRIDGYNYQDWDFPLKVGTNTTSNGGVSLALNSRINGDIVVGTGGDPQRVIRLRNNSSYTGQGYPASYEYKPGSVVLPAGLAGAPSSGNITGTTTISTSGKYNKIDLDFWDKLTIDGNVALYVTGDVNLNKQSAIEITEGSSLTLYYQGKIKTERQTSINNLTQKPLNFKIMGLPGAGKIEVGHQTDVYGIIYAPDSDFESSQGATVFGSVVVKTYKSSLGGKVMYDASLRDVGEGDNISLVPKRWSEY